MSTIFYFQYIFQSYYQGIIVATTNCFDLVVTLLQLVSNLWSRDIHGFSCLACIKKPKNLKAYNQRNLTRISLGAYYLVQKTKGEPELNLDRFGLMQNPNKSEFCRSKERELCSLWP